MSVLFRPFNLILQLFKVLVIVIIVSVHHMCARVCAHFTSHRWRAEDRFLE